MISSFRTLSPMPTDKMRMSSCHAVPAVVIRLLKSELDPPSVSGMRILGTLGRSPSVWNWVVRADSMASLMFVTEDSLGFCRFNIRFCNDALSWTEFIKIGFETESVNTLTPTRARPELTSSPLVTSAINLRIAFQSTLFVPSTANTTSTWLLHPWECVVPLNTARRHTSSSS